MQTTDELTLEAKIELLGDALNVINKSIYAVGAPAGSQTYFDIRCACVSTLGLCGIPIE